MQRFVILGNGPAGMKAAEIIRQIDQESPITVISNEEYSFYYRRYLPRFISGKIAEKNLFVKPQDFYELNRIVQKLGNGVAQVRPRDNSITLETGEAVPYDSLLISTGGKPIALNWPGKELGGLFSVRTLKDAKALIAKASISKKAVIIGGGLLGLNLAQSLQERGLKITLLGREDRVCANLLDKPASDFIERKLEEKGIELLLKSETEAFLGSDNQVEAVLTAEGERLNCDMVGIAVGTRPNIDFFKDSGIATNRGILVDDCLRTNYPNVYAAGDVAQAFDVTCGEQKVNTSWSIAEEQGAFAGRNMAGMETKYDGSLPSGTEAVYDMTLSSIGTANPPTPDFEVFSGFMKSGKVYKKFVIKDDRLRGAIIMNDLKDISSIERIIRQKISVSPVKSRLLDENLSLKQFLSEIP
jgi:nitrite reductase (NADH) large subunit